MITVSVLDPPQRLQGFEGTLAHLDTQRLPISTAQLCEVCYEVVSPPIASADSC